MIGRRNSTFFHPTENIDIYPPGMLNFELKTRCLNFAQIRSVYIHILVGFDGERGEGEGGERES